MGLNLIFWNPNMRLIRFGGLFWENVGQYGKTAIFLAAAAGLGKYRTGGYGRIGVYRDYNVD